MATFADRYINANLFSAVTRSKIKRMPGDRVIRTYDASHALEAFEHEGILYIERILYVIDGDKS